MDFFICRTPLQLELAKCIKSKIRSERVYVYINSSRKIKREDFSLVGINDDMFYFFNLFSDHSLAISFFNHIKVWLLIKKVINNFDISKLFIASIDNVIILKAAQLVLNKAKIYSFDDGYANFNYSGPYFNDNRSFNYRLLCLLMNLSLTMNQLKAKIVSHYTLAPGIENIIAEVEGVDLIPQSKGIPKIKGEVTVFIGTVYSVYGLSKDSPCLKSLLRGIAVDFYLPHPNEQRPLFDSGRNLTDIAEFEVIKLVGQYERVKLYGFTSTVLINLCSIDNVDIFLLKNRNSPSFDSLDDKAFRIIDLEVLT